MSQPRSEAFHNKMDPQPQSPLEFVGTTRQDQGGTGDQLYDPILLLKTARIEVGPRGANPLQWMHLARLMCSYGCEEWDAQCLDMLASDAKQLQVELVLWHSSGTHNACLS